VAEAVRRCRPIRSVSCTRLGVTRASARATAALDDAFIFRGQGHPLLQGPVDRSYPGRARRLARHVQLSIRSSPKRTSGADGRAVAQEYGAHITHSPTAHSPDGPNPNRVVGCRVANPGA